MDGVPGFRLDHLRRLTDDTGVVQHALYALPNPHFGYSIDDEARALIAALKHFNLTGDRASMGLATVYLRFLTYAQLPDGRFHNIMSFDRRWEDGVGSEDSNGRAVWALGYAALAGREESLHMAAAALLRRCFGWLGDLQFPRSEAFALLGLHYYLQSAPADDRARDLVDTLASRLVKRFESTASPDWEWFEDHLTYSNSRLPQALLLAHLTTPRPAYLDVAKRSLDFLLKVMHRESRDYVALVGQDGWYPRGGECARFDQQPVDAQALVDACLAAAQLLGGREYAKEARMAFMWYHGKNSTGRSLYDPETGGCRDGLEANGVNQNQGAESTIAYLLACLALAEAGELPLLSTVRPASAIIRNDSE